VSVKISEHHFQINAPAQQDVVNIFTSSLNGNAILEIHDMVGRKIWRQKIKLLGGEERLTLPVFLNKGVYLASLMVEGQSIITNKFIKQ
jgi:hypothetical protein